MNSRNEFKLFFYYFYYFYYFIIFDLIIFSQSLYKKLVTFYKICHLEKVRLPLFMIGLHDLHLERLREND
jgi:hypothetical protein